MAIEIPKGIDVTRFKQTSSALEQKLGLGYNVMAEVDMLRRDPNNENYVFENELTAACEAVGSSYGGMWSAHRSWDGAMGGFRAFGVSFIGVLQAGIDDISKKIDGEERPEYEFELARRQAELATEEWLTNSCKRGGIRNQIFLTISPYPEEVEGRVASNLGYKPEEKLGKLRFETFVEGVRQTIELSVARGSVRIFQNLAERLGYDKSPLTNSTSFLRTPISLGNSSNYLDTVINTARRYDSLLEDESKGSLQYFCGQEVKGESAKDYEQIVNRQRWVREKGRGLVEEVCALNLELAKSLNQGNPTEQIKTSLRYWIEAKDQKGMSLLDEEQLDLLKQAAQGNMMSSGVAFVLKKNELIRMWSVMACVVNEDKAKQMFGAEHVRLVQGFVESGSIHTSQARSQMDQKIAEVNPVFLACGGVLGGGRFGSVNLFQTSLAAARNTLFGGEHEWFVCPKCGYMADGPVGDSCPRGRPNSRGQLGCGLTKGTAGYASC